MRGFLWTEGHCGLAGSRADSRSLAAPLVCIAVGVAAGLAAAHVRLHLGLPGHKAILLVTPVIVARLVWGSSIGAIGGMLAAGLASMAGEGHWVGAGTHLAAAGLAGAALDAVIGFAERRRRLRSPWLIPLVGLAGLVANLVMLGERCLAPVFQSHQVAGLSGAETRLVSYGFFGLVSGLLGATASCAIWRLRGRRGGASSGVSASQGRDDPAK